MIIFRLLSLVFLLAGLVVVVGGGWLLMGNKLVIPENAAFGPQAEAVERVLPAEASAPAASSEAPASDGTFRPQMMPNARTFATADPISDMREVPIAYAAPEQAQFARAFEVTVAIDATGDDSAADVLPGDTRQVEDMALVTEKVRASISGSAFDITPISPETQIISDQTENIWRWKAVPRSTGQQELVVELFGFRGDDAVPIRTYRDSVSIEVSRVGQVIALAEQANPIAVFLGGVGSVLAGFFGFVRFFRS